MSARSSTLSVVIAVGAALSAVARRSTPPTRQTAAPPLVKRDTTPSSSRTDSLGIRTGYNLVCEFGAAGTASALQGCTARPTVVVALVVTVPDPLDSHLDWAFDSAIESVRRAFEHVGYSLDRYWLPWAVESDTGRRVNPTRPNLRTRAPGVMLFRSSSARADTVAIAYLVGETPTQGIHADAFQAALADRRLVMALADSGRNDTLRIVGPVFSGSARSLRAAVDAATLANGSTVLILSGGATAPQNSAILRQCVAGAVPTPKNSDCRHGPRIHFHATVNPLDRLKGTIELLMHDRFNIDRSQIAYLVESGTAYGQSFLPTKPSSVDSTTSQATNSGKAVPSGDSGRSLLGATTDTAATSARGGEADTAGRRQPETLALELPFPLNISRLRRDYARQPLLVDTTNRAAASRTLLDWRDPSAATESPAATSELTAPMIERTLSDIEQTLLLHRIRAVGIVATDVRDRLFLATVVKERVRDVQLFFIGSHSLYLRPELNETLRGALVVSTYPLFLENQFWDLTHNDRQRLVFTSDQSEGIYNAALIQLNAANDLTDYSYPMSRGGLSLRAPPVWITVVGANSLLPVVARASAVPLGARDTAYAYLRDRLAVQRTEAEPRRGNLEHVVVTVALLLMLIFIIGRHVARTIETLTKVGKRIHGLITQKAPDSPPITSAEGTVHKAPIELAIEERWRKMELTLLLHGEAWSVARYIAAISVIAPMSLILFRPREHGSGRALAGLVVIAGACAIALALAFVTAYVEVRRGEYLRRRLRKSEQPAEAAAAPTSPPPQTPPPSMTPKPSGERDTPALSEVRSDAIPAPQPEPTPPGGDTSTAGRRGTDMRAEVHGGLRSYAPFVQCFALVLLALLYLMLLINLMYEVVAFNDADAGIYFLRTLQISSGVTSVLPLVLGATIILLWCTWHLRRMRMLGDVSAFEIACADKTIDAATVPPVGRPTPDSNASIGASTASDPPTALGAAIGLQSCVNQIRAGLLSFLPRPDALILLGAIALFAPWTTEQSVRSIDTAILGPIAGWRWLPSAFDLLFRFLLFASLTLIAWTLRRLAAVWDSLRQCLRHVDALPLGDAFDRLPGSIAALARFTPFNAPSDSAVNLTIDRVAYARWLEFPKAAVWLPKTVKDQLLKDAEKPFPSLRTEGAKFDVSIATPLIAMHRALVEAITNDDVYLAAMVGTVAPPGRSERAAGGTVGSVQELVALYVIDYIEWVVRHLRQLAFYLILSLTLTMVFISSYPFAPSSVIRVIFFTLMALSVAAIAGILFQMNRNPTLSRIGHTTAGEITWDTQFILSLILVTGVPLITIISAEFPGVREFLFAWVTPALKAVAKT